VISIKEVLDNLESENEVNRARLDPERFFQIVALGDIESPAPAVRLAANQLQKTIVGAAEFKDRGGGVKVEGRDEAEGLDLVNFVS